MRHTLLQMLLLRCIRHTLHTSYVATNAVPVFVTGARNFPEICGSGGNAGKASVASNFLMYSRYRK